MITRRAALAGALALRTVARAQRGRVLRMVPQSNLASLDPIFSTGVHIAMQSGELAARAIDEALADDRFTAARFAPYQKALERGLRPFFRFIHKYYEPAFLETFMRPRTRFVLHAVLSVLSGGAFLRMRWSTRVALEVLFALAEDWYGTDRVELLAGAAAGSA